MSHFGLLVVLFFGIYLSECVLWVRTEGWLFFTWYRKFSLVQGPALRSRNLWPMGFAYRFIPPRDKGAAPVSLVLKDAEERWMEFQRQVRILNWFARGLLVIAGVSLLLFVIRRGFQLAWIALFIAFVFEHLSIAQTFWRAHRKLYPGQKGRLIKGSILCLVSPWQSSRAMDLLGDRLLEGFHPLVAAKLLLAEDLFLRFARRWMLELRYPYSTHRRQDNVPLLLCPTAEQEEKKLAHWMTGMGVDLLKLLEPPRSSHASHQSYCQRCDIEYAIPQGKCGDCGRDLVPFHV